MLSQNFKIVPHGFIDSGTISYSANEKTGEISTHEDIFGHVLFFTKELKSDDFDKIDPALFLSSAIVKGLKVSQGSVQLEVKSVVPGKSAVVGITINIPESKISGDGLMSISLSKQYWSIKHVIVTGNVDLPLIGNQALQVELVPA